MTRHSSHIHKNPHSLSAWIESVQAWIYVDPCWWSECFFLRLKIKWKLFLNYWMMRNEFGEFSGWSTQASNEREMETIWQMKDKAILDIIADLWFAHFNWILMNLGPILVCVWIVWFTHSKLLIGGGYQVAWCELKRTLDILFLCEGGAIVSEHLDYLITT